MISKSLNIAVCLSGESRTWKHAIPSIKNFFSSDKHNFSFFGHTWTESTYFKERLPTEIHCRDLLKSKMLEELDFSGLLIENKNLLSFLDNEIVPGMRPSSFSLKMAANAKKPTAYAHMSYSIMTANWLKQQFEFNNNMRFDLVVRTRHDLCYRPGCKFENFIFEEPLPTSLYCESNYFPNEYWLPHINDIFYFGNSRIMDVVDGFYRYYGSGKFHDMLGEEWNDCSYKVSGYNVNLHKWITTKNILIRNVVMSFPVVLRKAACHLNIIEDFNKLVEEDRKIFL